MENYDINEERISELRVLESAAGWYVGRTYEEELNGLFVPTPYSRESGYFQTKEMAEEELEFLLYCEELESE